jgi:4-hydroxybenzoate polyprenyltransferase
MSKTMTNSAKTSDYPHVFIDVLRQWAEMIKIEHTVFALPFALSGMILASPTIPPLSVWLWTMLAFLGARSAAMTLNRLIDANIDARNPRTSMRAIPAGKIKNAQAALFAIGSFALMLWAASHLPPLCLTLSPIAVIWLSFYSYTKRFTWLCHIALGIALGGAALGGWVAASGAVTGSAPWLLALAVATWVSGFDIIYASQDIAIDQKEKLHSIPAHFGLARALSISSALHLVTIACLIVLGAVLSLGPIYWTGALLVAVMLFYEHSLVKPNDLSKVDAAFFNINGYVSIAAFVSILLDKIF